MSQNRSLQAQLAVVSALIIVAALTRLLPLPHNFSAIGAMGLFGAAYLDRRLLAVAVPLFALYLSDVLLNTFVYSSYVSGIALLYPGFLWTYGAFALIVAAGFVVLRTMSVQRVIGGSLLASMIFFVVSNFGVWLGSELYPATMSGLIACYVAALPFFKNTLAGDLFFCGVLFGGYALLRQRLSALQPAT